MVNNEMKVVEKELICLCIYPYQNLIDGERYLVRKCFDGYYRVKGLTLSEVEFNNLFDIIKE